MHIEEFLDLIHFQSLAAKKRVLHALNNGLIESPSELLVYEPVDLENIEGISPSNAKKIHLFIKKHQLSPQDKKIRASLTRTKKTKTKKRIQTGEKKRELRLKRMANRPDSYSFDIDLQTLDFKCPGCRPFTYQYLRDSKHMLMNNLNMQTEEVGITHVKCYCHTTELYLLVHRRTTIPGERYKGRKKREKFFHYRFEFLYVDLNNIHSEHQDHYEDDYYYPSSTYLRQPDFLKKAIASLSKMISAVSIHSYKDHRAWIEQGITDFESLEVKSTQDLDEFLRCFTGIEPNKYLPSSRLFMDHWPVFIIHSDVPFDLIPGDLMITYVSLYPFMRHILHDMHPRAYAISDLNDTLIHRTKDLQLALRRKLNYTIGYAPIPRELVLRNYLEKFISCIYSWHDIQIRDMDADQLVNFLNEKYNTQLFTIYELPILEDTIYFHEILSSDD